MKTKHSCIIMALIVAAGLFFYFTKGGPLGKAWMNAAEPPVQAQEKSGGSMPGMPGMPAEKPAQKESSPAAATPGPAPGQDTSGQATVEISPEKQQLIGVKTTTASIQPLAKTIRTVGLVEYDQRRLKTINTKVGGWVEKLYVDFTGTYVKKGEPVADVYSPELWATEQEFINVVKWARRAKPKSGQQTAPTGGVEGTPDIGAMIDRDAETLVEAARQRLKLWDISDSQIKQIEESEKPIRTLTVYSPYSGYVMQKYVTQGMKVMAGEKLLDVADLSTVWITADVYEFELPLIKVGDRAMVQLSYFPGRQFSTRIDYIYPTLQGETRTAKARFTVPNENGRLKPQMFTNVDLNINLGRRLAVPSDSVINTGVRQVTYVDKGEGNFEPREVLTGVKTDKLVEITSGLKAGDKVASAANFLIDSEAKLKGVEPLPRKRSIAERGSRNAKRGEDTRAATPAPTQTHGH